MLYWCIFYVNIKKSLFFFYFDDYKNDKFIIFNSISRILYFTTKYNSIEIFTCNMFRWKQCDINLLYTMLKGAMSSRIVYFGIKEEEAGRSFSRIHESLKSTTTLRLIFGAAVVETIVATPQNRVFSYSPRPNSPFRYILSHHIRPLSFLEFSYAAAGPSCRTMVKIKSFVISPEILFPAYVRAFLPPRPFCASSTRASIDILALRCSKCALNKSEFE